MLLLFMLLRHTGTRYIAMLIALLLLLIDCSLLLLLMLLLRLPLCEYSLYVI